MITYQAPESFDEPVIPRRYFHLDSEFRQEWRHLLARSDPVALSLLDTDGSLFGLSDSETIDLLKAWVGASLAPMRLATFDEAYLINHAPKFQQLRGLFHDRIQWGIIPGSRRGQIQQAFVVAGDSVIKKPVRDAFRGFSERDIGTARGQLDYFEQVWQMCESAPPSAPLGL